MTIGVISAKKLGSWMLLTFRERKVPGTFIDVKGALDSICSVPEANQIQFGTEGVPENGDVR
jgi:hypothetical protein